MAVRKTLSAIKGVIETLQRYKEYLFEIRGIKTVSLTPQNIAIKRFSRSSPCTTISSRLLSYLALSNNFSGQQY